MLLRAALLAACVATLTTSAAPAQASDPIDIDLLNSDSSKVVMVDPTTGSVINVEAQAERISNRNICTDACFYCGRVPYANQGFCGTSGTDTGSWPARSGYNTGRYTARFCWDNDVCAPYLSPNTEAFCPGGARVTGKSVTIR
ncbi:hypothetical protein [Pilimelia terevasa]|nr:hypothetical protein [Pilimelia terevasa]